MQGVKTMGGLVDQRRARTSAGALMELAVLANEKKRLEQELGRWRRRHAEISARLAEIADKERRLFGFVEKLPQDAQVPPAAENGQRPRDRQGATAADNGQRLRTTEHSY
jgi:hypothetical protein